MWLHGGNSGETKPTIFLNKIEQGTKLVPVKLVLPHFTVKIAFTARHAGHKGHHLRSDMNIFQKACWNCHFSCWNPIRQQRAKNGRNVKHNTKTLSLVVSCIQVLVCLSQPESSSSIANSWANHEWKVPAPLGAFNSAEPHKAGIAYDAYDTYIYIAVSISIRRSTPQIQANAKSQVISAFCFVTAVHHHYAKFIEITHHPPRIRSVHNRISQVGKYPTTAAKNNAHQHN